MPPFEFVQQGDFTDTFTYTVPASGEVQPYTSTATYANSSGQAIQPTISIYSAEGNLLARVFPVTAVADGDTAEVTWMPPFGSAASSPSTGGSGWMFDTSPQAGDWGELEAGNGNLSPSGNDFNFVATGHDFNIEATQGNVLVNADTLDVVVTAGKALNVSSGTDTTFTCKGFEASVGIDGFIVEGSNAVPIIYAATIGGHDLFGVFDASHAQQSSAGITTVAQLVTVLKNYGFLS